MAAAGLRPGLTAAAPETAPSAQDALLATKLHLPRPQPGVVPRPRLAQQLDEGLGRGLVDAAAVVPLDCLARLRRAFAGGQDAGGPGPGAAPPVPVPGIIEPLTTRELEVLAMLAGGRSNQAIATELVVTLDTIKKRVSHVLGKLGAANRTEAVARGRELGLVP